MTNVDEWGPSFMVAGQHLSSSLPFNLFDHTWFYIGSYEYNNITVQNLFSAIHETVYGSPLRAFCHFLNIPNATKGQNKKTDTIF